LKRLLSAAIYRTKTDKTSPAVIASANAITVLVGAKQSFSGQDLSNISIYGANVRNGIFHETNFTGADLSYVNLSNT
jgi:uncharacterized protein YjbI with pentapeptide repeats